MLLDCDPNWNESKYFAAFDHHQIVHIWNLETSQRVSGHSAHMRGKNGNMAMCYTNNHQVLTIVGRQCIRYVVATNRYYIYEWSQKKTVTMLKASPFDDNIAAGGTFYGMIYLINTTGMSITSTLNTYTLFYMIN